VAAKKDNLPLSLRRDDDSTGTITYANEVIAIIAGVAANEVEGIAGMCTSGGISEVFGRNRNITKGVKVEIGSEEASVDLYVIVEYGTPIQTAALNVQESVRKAIETMTGLHVVRVDVHVQGVSFEKENKEFQASLASAELEKVTAGTEPEAPAAKAEPEAAEPAPQAPVPETIGEEAPAEAAPVEEAPATEGEAEPAKPEKRKKAAWNKRSPRDDAAEEPETDAEADSSEAEPAVDDPDAKAEPEAQA
jgi:uncharacterized alkaline shock family protein YloU